MTKTTVFTLQEYDASAAKKAGGNVTTHAQHRIIHFCRISASANSFIRLSVHAFIYVLIAKSCWT